MNAIQNNSQWRITLASERLARRYIGSVDSRSPSSPPVARLAVWVEGWRWSLLADVRDCRRSQEKVLKEIEAQARLHIKEMATYDADLAGKIRENHEARLKLESQKATNQRRTNHEILHRHV